MEEFSIESIFIIVVFSALTLYFIITIIIDGFKLFVLGKTHYTNKKISDFISTSTKDRTEIENILNIKFSYYIKLPSEEKKKFILKTLYFIDKTKFTTYDNADNSIETIVLISATAVQLTFGLPYCLSEKVKEIRLYPDVIHSTKRNISVKGFFHPNGIIVISTKHFKQDIEIETDGLHLGLHEMAHALTFLFKSKFDFNFLFFDIVTNWLQKTKLDYNYEDTTTTKFIRNYGITNPHEFFSVCIENFFERPQEFSSKMPRIYKNLTYLLNQNPLNPNFTEPTQINHNELIPPRFSESINFTKILLTTIISLSAIAFLIFYFPDTSTGFIAIIIAYNVSKVLAIFTVRRMFFYENYILIKSVLWRTKTIIPTNQIIYISAKETRRSSIQKELSIVFYLHGIKEKHDIFSSNKTFIDNLSKYAQTHNFEFFNKLST